MLGDLSKAFLQVSLKQNFRNYFKFFFPHQSEKISYRFARVPFGTWASPFLLYSALVRIDLELKKTNSRWESLVEKFYVDDLLWSYNTKEARDEYQQQVTTALLRFGFKINWKQEEQEKVLGLIWHTKPDIFMLQSVDLKLPTTVRELASFIPKVYDPLGLIEPVMAEFRRMFSLAWKTNKNWESKISEEQLELLKLLILDLQQWLEIQWPRFVGVSNLSHVQLAVFTDANETNIGVSIYVVTDKLHLLYSKSKIHHSSWADEAELNALVLCIKILHNLFEKPEYEIQIFSDSRINIDRLKGHSINQLKYHTIRRIFTVKNYLREHKIKFGHISGNMNPADLLTKFKRTRNTLRLWASPEVNLPDETLEEIVTLTCITEASPVRLSNIQLILDDIDLADSLEQLLETYDIDTLISAVQQSTWPEEIKALQTGKAMPKKVNFRFILVHISIWNCENKDTA